MLSDEVTALRWRSTKSGQKVAQKDDADETIDDEDHIDLIFCFATTGSVRC